MFPCISLLHQDLDGSPALGGDQMRPPLNRWERGDLAVATQLTSWADCFLCTCHAHLAPTGEAGQVQG